MQWCGCRCSSDDGHAAQQALEAGGARKLRNESFFSAPQLKRDPLGSMTEHQSSIPDDRPLTSKEITLLRWLLEHGTDSAAQHVGEIEKLRVASRCGCGCASIDFVRAPGS